CRRRALGGAVWALLAGTVAYLILVPGAVAYFRFRVPAAPILSLAAGVAMASLADAVRRRNPFRIADCGLRIEGF
ncbi:hypothetical protein LCGC14_2548380, partial [marine sediment metagenome]